MKIRNIIATGAMVHQYLRTEVDCETFKTQPIPIYRFVLAIILPLPIFFNLYLLKGGGPGFWVMWISATGLMLLFWTPRYWLQCQRRRLKDDELCGGRVRLHLIGLWLTCTRCEGVTLIG